MFAEDHQVEAKQVYFLVRQGSEGKVKALREFWGVSAARVIPVAGDLTSMVVYGVPENYYDGYAASVNATDPQRASVAARAIVGDGPTTWVVVGDLSKIEAGVRALNLGPVEVWDAQGVRLR